MSLFDSLNDMENKECEKIGLLNYKKQISDLEKQLSQLKQEKECDYKKYKKAWEEIMNFYKVELKDTMSKNDYFVLYKLKEIAKKNGI